MLCIDYQIDASFCLKVEDSRTLGRCEVTHWRVARERPRKRCVQLNHLRRWVSKMRSRRQLSSLLTYFGYLTVMAAAEWTCKFLQVSRVLFSGRLHCFALIGTFSHLAITWLLSANCAGIQKYQFKKCMNWIELDLNAIELDSDDKISRQLMFGLNSGRYHWRLF